jgi:predicted acylesterase/phospholipase RssA
MAVENRGDRGRPVCDLVMKGGITSGVVYPTAVQVLADRYDFRSIGGASAGAIAAALTAASEYGKRRGAGGYGELDRVVADLRVPGFLRGLFQPSPATRPGFELVLGLTDRTRSTATKLAAIVARGLLAAWWLSAPVVVLAAALVWALAVGEEGGRAVLGWAGSLLLALVALVAAAAVGLVILAMRLRRGLEEGGFGVCGGRPQPRSGAPALSDWLHERIQACAGRAVDDPPVTFRDLAENVPDPIVLRLITTDLSHGRPVLLPVESRAYLFRRADLNAVIPEGVVEWMWGRAEVPEWIELATEREAEEFRYLPADDMPILLAARLSLSFPVLISAVRLWSYDALGGGLLETWMSDGGISSNFPIHFFDAFLPGHPTFGLDLAPGAAAAGIPEVWMPDRPGDQRPPRWRGVGDLVGFLRQIADVMQNWRDTMQAEMPGSRDRICQIRLAEGEGGLNVDMDREAVDSLIGKGRLAGRTIVEGFDARRWENHRFTRYLTSMQRLQVELQRMGDRFEAYEPSLAGGAKEVDEYRSCHDETWCREAARETADLLDVARRWGPGGVDFFQDRGCRSDPSTCRHCEPEPRPSLRIVPNV